MRTNPRRAFSLVEVLIALSVLGVLATVAVLSVGNVVGSAKEKKLEGDVDTLNRAVVAYIASGGDLSGISDPGEVIQLMKRKSDASDRVAGHSGSVIDNRLGLRMQSSEEAGSGEARAVWNPAKLRFEIAQGGDGPGIAEFILDDSHAVTVEEEVQRAAPVLYSKESTWIWDYQDATATSAPAPSEFTMTPVPDSTTTPPPGPPSSPVVSLETLQPPVFSIPAGTYPGTSFDLELQLSDPNPPGAGRVYYSIDYGNWVPYSGNIRVPPDAVVAAQVVPLTDTYSSSSRGENRYTAQRLPLRAPTITLSASEFNDNTETIRVTLQNPNTAGLSTLRFAVIEPGGTFPHPELWQDYTGSFDVAASNFPSGFVVGAYAKAIDTRGYSDSPRAQAEAGADFMFSDAGGGEVLYVIDASGSMDSKVGTTTRFALIQEALKGAISRLRSTTRFSVVTFAGGIVWTDGSWNFREANAANKQAMINQIANFKTDHGTNYEAGLGTVLNYSSKPRRVYFLTDGQPTGGGNYLDEVAAIAVSGIPVHTIGVDLNNNARSLLEEIAKLTGGKSSMVSTE